MSRAAFNHEVTYVNCPHEVRVALQRVRSPHAPRFIRRQWQCRGVSREPRDTPHTVGSTACNDEKLAHLVVRCVHHPHAQGLAIVHREALRARRPRSNALLGQKCQQRDAAVVRGGELCASKKQCEVLVSACRSQEMTQLEHGQHGGRTMHCFSSLTTTALMAEARAPCD